MLPSVHNDCTRLLFINDKQAFRYTNNTVSDYFHLKTDLHKSGKALTSLVAPSPTPLCMHSYMQIKFIEQLITIRLAPRCC